MRQNLSFFIREAFRSLSTNKATSAAAVVAMLVALLLVGLAGAATLKARSTTQDLQKDVGTLRVYLVDTIEEDQINALTAQLKGDDRVEPGSEGVRYISKPEALELAKEQFKDSPEIFENLSGNPFPAELKVRLVDPTQLAEVRADIEGQAGVSEVNSGPESVESVIEGLANFAVWVAGFGLMVLIAATVLVANTIRLSIYARRREIEVMKLVGASNSFVRVPFMIEGVIVGLFAAALASLVTFGLVDLISGFIDENFGDGFLNSSGDPVPMGYVLLGLFGVGTVLGVLGSASSMRRYLRV